MSVLIHLCRFIGVVSGFVVPVVGGLHAASTGNVKHANYYLRALVFWVILDRIFSPVLFALLGIVSDSLWPLTFSILSVLLVTPRSRALELADKYTVMALKNGLVTVATTKLCEVMEIIKEQIESLICTVSSGCSKKEE
ncbi:putative integral membrane protein [Babesia bovis T2Bo]|uniref:Membrane protein, putative n=1 Tax=Babesia bovis TaxID=5865 RepID=A7AM73_BABBO|nr:putative integral membrane protein [Babesia bovis T2Bo]EDO07657.1 putative integral membrane protein [Babesia bovis T2Bo]|eukprot:XP_001611225.1 membrane protein [Babesia bovis T2Bo]